MRKSFLPAVALATALAPAAAYGQAQPAGDIVSGKSEKVRFYGLAMDFSAYDASSLNALNYTNEISMYFQPRWNLGRLWMKGTPFERLAISGRFVLSYDPVGYDEGSYIASSDLGPPQPCSNVTPSTNGGTVDPTQIKRCDYPQYHRWDPGDIWLSVSNARIVTIPGVGIGLSPSMRFVLPTSKQSQYQTLLLGLTGGLRADRSFFDGKFGLNYTLLATKNFHRYTSPVAVAAETQGDTLVGYSPNYHLSDAISPGGPEPFNLTSFARNSSYGFTHIFGIDVEPIDKLSISVLYILVDNFRYPYSDNDTILVNGQPHDLQKTGQQVAANSGSNVLQQAHSDSQIFWATVGYQALDWLNVSLSLITASPQRHPDGTLRQPFLSFDYNAFSQVSFGFAVSLEKVAAKLIK